jgi:hypothetical protein
VYYSYTHPQRPSHQTLSRSDRTDQTFAGLRESVEKLEWSRRNYACRDCWWRLVVDWRDFEGTDRGSSGFGGSAVMDELQQEGEAVRWELDRWISGCTSF